MGLVKLFEEKDIFLIEVNLLVIMFEGNLYCLDVKLVIDGNVVLCYLDLVDMYDLS